MRYLFTVLAAALTLAALPASAFDMKAMSDGERRAFRAEVREYLVENPEVIMEAIQVLKDRQARAEAAGDAALVKEHAAAIFADGHSWVGGDPEGDVTLVEFMDYRCGYCRKAFAEVEGLVAEDGDIRFVLKEFPILGPQSELAARFAIATRQTAGDAAYKTVHDALMTFRGDFDRPALRRVAAAHDLDPGAILAAMDAPAVSRVIRENRALARDLQVRGTPTFVLAGEMLRGYVPRAAMERLIAEARAE